jgi:polyisoprenoid-binding protein YceI
MRAVLAASILMAIAPASRAETLRIDSPASKANFEVRVLLVKRIGGGFGKVEGLIERDRAAGRFDVDVRVAADSVLMAREANAQWARSADFFDAARHPWIHFRAEGLPENLLQDGGEIDGELTLRGITQPVRFALEASECPRPGIDCAVRAAGEVKRSDFGMEARRFVVADRVQFDFAIRVIPAPSVIPAKAGIQVR